MRTYLITISLLFLVISIQSQSRIQPLTKINVSAFEYKSHDLDGCGEAYYFTSKERDKQNQYILLSDYDTAVMMINHHLERMKAASEYNKSVSVYTNSDYKVVIKISQNKAADYEYYITTASMNIYFHGRLMFTKKVYGGGGC